MKIGTAEITSKIDDYCINQLKIPGIVLMENAALKVIKNIELDKFNSFVIVCGKGNNGGDGFAIARHLYLLNKNIEVFLIGTNSGMTADCKTNYDILKALGIKISTVSNLEDIGTLRDALERNEVTVDAIFGTGLSRNVQGIYDNVMTIINENGSYIISVDVPSGLNGTSGKIMGNCIEADKTISFQLYKKGFLNYGTDKYTGDIVVENIGIPEEAINRFHKNEFIIDKHMIKENILKRNKYSYKGDYGKALIVAGSKGFTGAAFISTEGAIKSGVGLVTLCSYEEIQPILSCKLAEAMTISFKDGEKLKDLLEKSDSIAIGPGMGDNETTFQIVKDVILNANCPIVIDADGINVLKNNVDLLKKKKRNIVITPHLGEMARITNLSIEYITENRIEVAKNFAKKYGIIVLLKGYNTIITDGEMMVINPTGNSAMASGGMGDCLTGIIASFIAQGYDPIKAAYLAAYIHGYCGEKLSKDMFCVNASAILEKLPYAIKELQS